MAALLFGPDSAPHQTSPNAFWGKEAPPAAVPPSPKISSDCPSLLLYGTFAPRAPAMLHLVPACSHISSAISCKQHKHLFCRTGEPADLIEDQLQRNDMHCTGSDMAKNRTTLFRGSKPWLSIRPYVK